MQATGPRRFFALLGVILVVALGVRVAYVLGSAQNDHRFYDAAYYELQARAIADGRGYVDPFPGAHGHAPGVHPSAEHPPLTVLALVPVAKVGNVLGLSDADSRLAMRFEVALVGLVGVFLIGLLGRDLAGDRTGLIAAGIAAVYPYLWVNDGLIMSEAFAVVATTSALILALRLLRRPSLGRALALGAVCGCATLARAELVLLAPLLGIPLLMSFREIPWSRRLTIVGSLAVGAVVLVGPWVAFNLSRFDETTLLSTNDGTAMLASSCDAAYYGPSTGLTNIFKCIPHDVPAGDLSTISRVYRNHALDYIGNHKPRTVVVVLARIGRDWGLFRPGDMPTYNIAEGRPKWVTELGMVFYYPILAFAIVGVAVLRRRRIRQWPLLIPPVIVTLGTVLAYGQTRFRVPAEPSLVVLAGVGIAALVAHWWPEPAPAAESAGDTPAPEPGQAGESSTIDASSSS